MEDCCGFGCMPAGADCCFGISYCPTGQKCPQQGEEGCSTGEDIFTLVLQSRIQIIDKCFKHFDHLNSVISCRNKQNETVKFIYFRGQFWLFPEFPFGRKVKLRLPV